MKNITFLFTALVVLFLSPVSAQDLLNVNKKSVAVKGYDVVTYFTNAQAVEGNTSISSTNQGATYYFSTEENKDLFDQNPDKYLPMYGGWCAYAMGAKGKKVSINPEAFSVEDDKLYLFYKRGAANTLKQWKKNTAKLKEKADNNWSTMVGDQD